MLTFAAFLSEEKVVMHDGDFVINFHGLALGVHQFNFEIDDSFFEWVEDTELSEGDIAVNVTLDRQERMLVFDFDISGSVFVPCDRCLDPFDLPVEGKQKLIVKFGEQFGEESDDVIILPSVVHQIDLSQYIYEYIHLLLPYQRVHPEDEEGNSLCDQEQLKRLEELSKVKEIDPRWDKLRGFALEN
ncbi:MAG: DUF177 domain-containing protein [Bacteroidetes bacterium]|nr:DUF177 domain-containing protein [Bacteroidota bacterium]